MSIILSIETATPICSVALHADDMLIGKISIQKGQSHSSVLNEAIHNLINLVNISLKDLSAVAVSKGPGSYTGLRIGTSTAKGLCYALDIPLISVETLTAMAKGVINIHKHLLCPMLDARRMEVYASVFTSDLHVLNPISPVILDENSFADHLQNNKVIFFGDGAKKFREITKSLNALFIDSVYPDAEYIGSLAFEKFQNNVFEDVAYFEPFYLKEFKATKPKSML
ncbi:tRNA (adenosine(37)-N6)-threonylcarbamoyltransferase complex dimerization subunit type 1 TsaB [Fulvivirga lutea]|uniref:tRNA (Adenosine(37)-N6)-threonylcarbamoyltransferase complex dimerization subunit type 1 TsaB n=1 Tax=Fulvivirga lutea TaxID=2810512 RepID=A0A974WIQ6_9BACT|nr:tRNA (adenosine(37)-N6)-threonylcarbamoyltransferase complex dimerization subunit type 1 TsaB [Fulvivirga lutea]QSE97942.1 tRNA (adenosine(37)-N6)-threonylcarbamoyltransferase complex dimerization subunit type 1 TsaB [Fulvivirga lutea]